MTQFRKKPVVIEATQITAQMEIDTLEGTMTGSPGDYLITGVKGEKYFCKPDIFDLTYELATEEVPIPTAPDLIREHRKEWSCAAEIRIQANGVFCPVHEHLESWNLDGCDPVVIVKRKSVEE